MFRPLTMLAAVAALAGSVSVSNAQPSTKSPAQPAVDVRVERRDARLDALIQKDAKFEVVADGFEWLDGTVWDRKGKALLFSENPKNRIMRWSPEDGLSEFLNPSGYTGKEQFVGYEPGSNGLAFDKDGRLVMCMQGDRRIARLSEDRKSFETLADRYVGNRLNSPNDLTFARNGDLYFTDPADGLPFHEEDENKELDVQGVYRLSPKGELTLLLPELSWPNGIDLSPDQKTLYVSYSGHLKYKAVLMAFSLGSDGDVSGPGKQVYDWTPEFRAHTAEGSPNGLRVDRQGNVFAVGPGGVFVFAPDHALLGKIMISGQTGNLAWGEDGSVLYITTQNRVLRVRTATSGPGF